ncbi:tripartite tricarboxylate transporter TctB family protein [Ancylobacter sp. A5.8]|uniref:tripartite tricarboxylate transporter TctB family protein n=1 Tax=Ancylobacter gelatini TaxID=2919920 RepID=UPI001F4F023E|nr:tripartite tricarboxylate transporter TctB family protein [Ancylobacter gelatini]MCJ8144003.1 tripartite tricarboxylate transporter TctB family protein [Ancylobacter gelatini]
MFSRDFLAGLMMLLVAGALFFDGRGLEFGTPEMMGPGFFPFLAAGGLALLSTILMVSGLAAGAPRLEPMGVRAPVMVILAGVAFAVLLDHVGALAATVAVVVLCALSIRDFRWKEVALVAIGMAALVGFLFVYFLQLPMAM